MLSATKKKLFFLLMFLLLFSSSPYRAKHVHISIILFGTNGFLKKKEIVMKLFLSLLQGAKKILFFSAEKFCLFISVFIFIKKFLLNGNLHSRKQIQFCKDNKSSNYYQFIHYLVQRMSGKLFQVENLENNFLFKYVV